MLNLLIWLPLLIAQSTAQSHDTAQNVSYRVSYRPMKGHGAPVLAVRLNLSAKLSFVLDTGSNTCAVSDAVVTRLKLKAEPALRQDGSRVFLGGIPAEFVTCLIDLNGMTIPDVPMVVMPKADLDHVFPERCDGILGSNMLSGLPTRIDCRRHAVEFWPEGLPETVVNEFLAAGGVSVPLVTIDALVYGIRATLNDAAEEDLLVDTGAERTLVQRKDVEALKIRIRRESLFLTTVLGSTLVHPVELNSLSIAGCKLTTPKAWCPDLERGPTIPTLGMDNLSGMELLFDIPHMKLYIKPAADRKTTGRRS